MVCAIKATPILVAGAGSWGTALAILLARNDQAVYLWGHRPEHIRDLQRDRCNRRYLPDVEFPENLRTIVDLTSIPGEISDIIIAVPCKGMEKVLSKLVGLSIPGIRAAWACKGLDPGTHRLLHEVVKDMLGADVPAAVISGPSFAAEVAAGLPTAVTVASENRQFAIDLVSRLHSSVFRAYVSDDVIGVEVGGAVKNVLAIAAGVADGLGFGANSRAALITRGLAEITRLGVALGGQRETFTGLAGLGDLVLTCTDNQSRNRRLGLALAKGETVEEATTGIGQAVEGIRTAFEVGELASVKQVDMPITEQVCRILRAECEPVEAVQALLSREPREETEAYSAGG